jgi:methionine-rich copper-binding protein CopC
VNEETTPKGITWKRHRAGAVAGAALAALTMIGVASSGSAHAGVTTTTTATTKAPTTIPTPYARSGWGG